MKLGFHYPFIPVPPLRIPQSSHDYFPERAFSDSWSSDVPRTSHFDEYEYGYERRVEHDYDRVPPYDYHRGRFAREESFASNSHYIHRSNSTGDIHRALSYEGRESESGAKYYASHHRQVASSVADSSLFLSYL
jgi:hypothetical protein